jgi:hypothetical protein
MTSVPENWIPFIGVRAKGSDREIELQRGAMLRQVDGDPLPAARVRPRTTLLRVGLDQPSPAAFRLAEEEVPRAGVRVRLAFRRARGTDGRVAVWLAAAKRVGRGEGSSGLAFDQIADLRQ